MSRGIKHEYDIPLKYQDGIPRHFRLWSRRTGIPLNELLLLLKFQDGVCAICGGVGKRTLAIDHDHAHCEYGCRRCIRGFLCGNCNVGLGNFQDDPITLLRAAAYLRSNDRPLQSVR